MPTRARKQRDRDRLANKQTLDSAVSNAPAHIRNRLGQTSELSKNLHTKGQHNAGWAKFDERGQNIKKHEDPERQGANLERKENRKSDAQELQRKYVELWGKRGVAKRIAHAEGLKVGTVRRYMKDFPI